MPKVINLPIATQMDETDYLIMEESTGGTKKITRANALSPIGTIVSAVGTLTSIPHNTNTDMCSISLTKGKWVVVGQSYWECRAGFSCWACISTASAQKQISYGGFQQVTSTPETAMSLTRIIDVTSASQTIYLVGFQNSGSAQSISGTPQRNNIYAIRIA